MSRVARYLSHRSIVTWRHTRSEPRELKPRRSSQKHRGRSTQSGHVSIRFERRKYNHLLSRFNLTLVSKRRRPISRNLISRLSELALQTMPVGQLRCERSERRRGTRALISRCRVAGGLLEGEKAVVNGTDSMKQITEKVQSKDRLNVFDRKYWSENQT